MFHFSGYALLFFRQEQLRFTQLGFPIRKSPDQRLLTPPRSLSQLRRVLHRHLMPRHPPYALNFTFHYGTSDLLSQYSCAPYTNVSTKLKSWFCIKCKKQGGNRSLSAFPTSDAAIGQNHDSRRVRKFYFTSSSLLLAVVITTSSLSFLELEIKFLLSISENICAGDT